MGLLAVLRTLFMRYSSMSSMRRTLGYYPFGVRAQHDETTRSGSSFRSRRLPFLDILRALAILLVLGRHIPWSWTEGTDLLSASLVIWQRGGWIGVDLFFVLSGFLVSGLLFREYEAFGSVQAGRFLVRRGLKLYPAFWAFLATSLIVLSWQGSTLRWGSIVAELLFVQNYFEGVWIHTWTLAVEEHFYLLLTLFVMAAIERRPAGSDPFARHRPLGAVVGTRLPRTTFSVPASWFQLSAGLLP